MFTNDGARCVTIIRTTQLLRDFYCNKALKFPHKVTLVLTSLIDSLSCNKALG